jgi:cation:H+ antiporter
MVLLALLVLYLALSVHWSRNHSDPSQAVTEVARRSPALLIGMVVAGLAVVVISSHVLIEVATELAVRFGVPQVVIASTLVALGTSLPELIVGLTAVRQKQPELLVGNVIGADILNILFVIGASAVAAPLPIIDDTSRIPALFLVLHLPAMLVVLALFRFYVFRAVRSGSFERWMGAPLLVLYTVYTLVQFVLGRQ